MTPALVFAVVVATAAGANDASVEKRIAHAQGALANLEYDAAADELMLAATDKNASDEQRVRANLLAGICNRIIGRDVDARLNFRYVLSKDPDAKLPPDAAPKVVAFFELVRQEILAEKANVAAATATAAAATPPPAPKPDTSPGDPTKTTASLEKRGDEVGDGLKNTAHSVGPTASWLLVGVGAIATVGGAVTAGACEGLLGDPSKPAADRQSYIDVGQQALLVSGLGVLVAGGGVVFLVLGGDG